MNDTAIMVQRHKQIQPWLNLSFIMLLAGGWLYYPLGYFLLACMAGAMGIGIIKGRYWCDWLCPRGSFFDTLLSKISRAREVPRLFRQPAFRLGWLAILMTMLTIQLIPVWGDFYLMGKPFVMVLTITTIVGTLFGILYHQRIWCMFCPMGTMANWLGRGKMILKINDKCSQCGTCEKVCRMQIKPGSYQEVGQVNHGDCLKCSYCVDSCPQQALSFSDVEERKGR